MSDVRATMGLDASGFKAGLAGASAELKNFSTNQLGAIKGQLAAAFAVGALTQFTKSCIDLGSNVADMATRTNLSTDSVQKLDFAAKQSGSTFDAVAGGLKKLAASLSEAKGGNKEAIASFAALGITMEELQAMTPEQAFLRISDAFANSADPAETLANGMKVMGRSTQELIPLLVEGAEGIKKLGDAAPLMSQQTVEAMDAAGDAIERLKAKATSVGAPVVGFFANLVNRTVQGVELLTAISANAFQDLEIQKQAIDLLVNEMEPGKKGKPASSGKADKFSTAVAGGTGPLEGAADAAREASAAAGKAARDEAASKERVLRLTERIHELTIDALAPIQKMKALEDDLAAAKARTAGAMSEEAALTGMKDVLEIEKEIKKIKDQQAQESKRKAGQHAKAAADIKAIEGGEGISVSAPMTDALARIGGFVGQGGDERQRDAERQLKVQEEILEYMKKLDAKIFGGGAGDATSGV